MREINFQVMSQVRHASVDCIKEIILIEIILGIEPFFFQLSPHRLSNVQMWGIRRKKEYVQTSFLPVRNALANDFCLMQPGIIQHHKRLLIKQKRKILHVWGY